MEEKVNLGEKGKDKRRLRRARKKNNACTAKKKQKKGDKNKAGYAAQDAPSMRTFHLRKKHGTDLRTYGRTDGRTDTTAHLKTAKKGSHGGKKRKN